MSQNLRRFQTYQSPPQVHLKTWRWPIECADSASFLHFLPYNSKQLLQEMILLSRPWAWNCKTTVWLQACDLVIQSCLHLFASQDFRRLWALPHRSLLPCATSSLSAEPCCNHIDISAACRNKRRLKTLETLLLDSVGRKLQNNTMTTSVRSRNSILPASVCSMRRVCGISRLQKSLSLVLVLPISLATSIFAPLRHLKPICGVQPHLQICCAQEQVQGDPSWERLTCHVFTARCKGATPTIQSTADLFLQHVTRQAARVSRLRPAAPWSNTQSTAPVLWKLKRDLRGPWVKVSHSKIGWDTYTNPWNTWNQAEYRKLNSTSPFHLLSRRLSDFTASKSQICNLQHEAEQI